MTGCRDADGKLDPAYKQAMLWAALTGALYSLGVPAIFGYLVHRYHKCGRQATPGDRMRHAAVGWMYDPFRLGQEWWLWGEMLRLLLLTSALGFLSQTCWMKLAVALFIAFFFIVIFQHAHPCTSL